MESARVTYALRMALSPTVQAQALTVAASIGTELVIG
jgi:hypothetical protein